MSSAASSDEYTRAYPTSIPDCIRPLEALAILDKLCDSESDCNEADRKT